MGFGDAGMYFNPMAKQVSLTKYRGKRIGVDFSVLWYQISCGLLPESRLWIVRLIKLLKVLQSFQVIPVMVFDGTSKVPWKIVSKQRKEKHARQLKRKGSAEHKVNVRVAKRQKLELELVEQTQEEQELDSSTAVAAVAAAAAAVSTSKTDSTRQQQQRQEQCRKEIDALNTQILDEATKLNKIVSSICTRMPEDNAIVKRVCAMFGLECVDAELEADYTLGALYRTQQIDASLTDDFDTPLHGIMVMLRSSYGDISQFSMQDEEGATVREYNFEEILNQDALTCSVSELRDMSFLVGNDYTVGMPGVGKESMVKLIREHGCAMAVWSHFVSRFDWTHACEQICLTEHDLDAFDNISHPHDTTDDDTIKIQSIDDHDKNVAAMLEREYTFFKRASIVSLSDKMFRVSNYAHHHLSHSSSQQQQQDSYRQHIRQAIRDVCFLLCATRTRIREITHLKEQARALKQLKRTQFGMNWLYFHAQYADGQRAFDDTHDNEITRLTPLDQVRFEVPNPNDLQNLLDEYHLLHVTEDDDTHKNYVNLDTFARNKIDTSGAANLQRRQTYKNAYWNDGLGSIPQQDGVAEHTSLPCFFV